MIEGKVIKGIGGIYTVDTTDRTVECLPLKKLRKDGLYVGDNVRILMQGNKGCIQSVLPRKNVLVRPPVANIDKVFIIISSTPEPDLLLIDKLIINCLHNNIDYCLIANKTDLLTEQFARRIKDNYGDVEQITFTSAITRQGISQLEQLIDDKVCCFAGQSGVGKTSLLNTLVDNANALTGQLSVRIDRGKNTTRHAQIYKCGAGYIVDTAGFSLLELPIDSINAEQLMTYYADFCKYSFGCKFTTKCTHISEPNCAVKEAVANGLICAERYARYKTIVSQLIDAHKHQY
ncbi:MAG: ribosome small subunit-dependent GTPase A [Clostridia bacterium]|nr:ribosome small subunit-dependent GTPase A [Clostridia bacterium]